MPLHRIFHTAQRGSLLRLLVLALLTSCGGVDSGGTGGSAAYGPINGLGSIIVNGVRFDDSNAAITDEDGESVERDRLQLGVMTSVEGGDVVGPADDRRATAHRVRIFSELIGPIGAIDASTQTIEVLGQTVRITSATVFGDGLPAGFASLQVGMVVEVFARLDSATDRYGATRIELRPGPAWYSVRGKVGQVDATARTFQVGALVVDFSQLTTVDAAKVVLGNIVRVRLETSPSAAGVWRALSVSSGQRPIADAEEAHIEGRISAFESPQRFSVDGVTVDATDAAFPDGTAAISLGARVSVEGSARGGVVYAKEVHVEDDEDESGSTFEVHGTIEALDAAARTMIVRGTAVDFSGAVAFENGTINDLRVGRSVEIEGVLQPDGVGLVARKISFGGT
jgi:hypothetical protein